MDLDIEEIKLNLSAYVRHYIKMMEAVAPTVNKSVIHTPSSNFGSFRRSEQVANRGPASFLQVADFA